MATVECVWCGAPFTRPTGRGQPRKYCSSSCKRAREKYAKRDKRRELDPLVGSEERRRNQLAGLKERRRVAVEIRETLGALRDLRWGTNVGTVMPEADGLVELKGTNRTWDGPRRLRKDEPYVDSDPTGCPPGLTFDPVWAHFRKVKAAREHARLEGHLNGSPEPRIYWQRVNWPRSELAKASADGTYSFEDKNGITHVWTDDTESSTRRGESMPDEFERRIAALTRAEEAALVTLYEIRAVKEELVLTYPAHSEQIEMLLADIAAKGR